MGWARAGGPRKVVSREKRGPGGGWADGLVGKDSDPIKSWKADVRGKQNRLRTEEGST